MSAFVLNSSQAANTNCDIQLVEYSKDLPSAFHHHHHNNHLRRGSHSKSNNCLCRNSEQSEETMAPLAKDISDSHLCPLPNLLLKGDFTFRRRKNEEVRCLQEKGVQAVKRSDDYEEMKSRLQRTLEENIRLRSVIHDVTEVNKRWQKYNQERQEYVQKLLSTIKEFQQKEQLNVNEINSKSQAETSSFLGSSDYLKYENDVLLNDLEESERRCRHLNDKLLGVKRDLNEKIELLELQIKVQAEDFEAERKEKVDAVLQVNQYLEENIKFSKKMVELEKRHKQSKVYVCTCQNNARRDGVVCRVAQLQRNQRSSHSHEILVLPCQLLPRSSSASNLHLRHELDYNETSPSLLSRESLSLSSPLSPSLASRNQEQSVDSNELRKARWLLVCPKCRKHFPPNLEIQFSSHVEGCNDVSYRCSQ